MTQSLTELLTEFFDEHDVVCLGNQTRCAEVRASDREGNSAHLAEAVIELLTKDAKENP